MNEWLDELADLSAAGERAVIVTVASIRGSAPREVGAKMLVTATQTIGTIGGGQLEYQCSRIACELLGDDERPRLRKFPLGASLGQCCGGVVEILFEPVASVLPAWLQDLRALHGQREPAVMATRTRGAAGKLIVTANNVYGATDDDAGVLAAACEALEARRVVRECQDWLLEMVVGSDFNVAVFGAGHVGAAVVQSLASLDCNIRWIDSRRHIFRRAASNVRNIETADPAAEVAALPPGSFYLVMTHSHSIDFNICQRILQRDDAAYCGLIGSVAKRRRFEKRWRALGISDRAIEALRCPIGVAGISGKKPAEIAVAVAAELLRSYEKAHQQAELAYADNVYALTNKQQ